MVKKKGISISKIKGIGKKVEKVLAGAGFNTIEKIASSKVNELTKLEGIGKKGAERIITSAKELLEAK